MVALSVLIMATLEKKGGLSGGNVFKNSARYTC